MNAHVVAVGFDPAHAFGKRLRPQIVLLEGPCSCPRV
jgi:hypothetical protein